MANEKRLIDANAVIKKIDDYYHNSPFPHPGTTWLRGLELAVGLLLNEPTVDAVEVAHGRWIEKLTPIEWCEDDADIIWECSLCECRHFADSNYCPNCGAKMDGDGNA